MLDTIGVDAAHVFDVSMGNMIAQEFVFNYPDKLLSLISGCTHCGEAKIIFRSAEALAFLFYPARAKLPVHERAGQTVPWLWTQEFINNNPEAVQLNVGISLRNIAHLFMDLPVKHRQSWAMIPTSGCLKSRCRVWL